MSKIIGVTVGTPTSPAAMEEKIKPVKSVNGNFPDESGNVEIDVPESDLTGYATEQYVKDYAQPKGNYLTEHQDISGKLDADKLPEAVNAALAQAKASGAFDGEDGYTPVKGKDYFDGEPGYTPQKGIDYDDGADGQRGTGILKVTTQPSSYTTAIGSYTPKYRIALSTLKSQSKVDTVLIGDIIQNSYYQYQIDYLDSSYAYISATRVSLRGATGAAGSDANVTTENITAALGYTPANPDDITAVEEVYIGAEPPTDPAVKLWVNTSKPGNKPGVGTSAPADWNAAEGEPGHILNRTHYGEWVMLFPEAELMPAEYETFVGMMETEAKAFRTFRTTYNGVVYEGKSYNAGGTICFGNMSASDFGEDTGEPFLAMIADGMLMVMPLDGAASVTMQVEMFDIVEKLPKQFYNHHVFIDVDVAEDGTYSTQVVPMQVMSEISEDDVPVIRLHRDLAGTEGIRYLTDIEVSLGGAMISALFLDSMKRITLLTIGPDNDDVTIPYTINVTTKGI